MGRKIPAKKHRGVKDPLKQQEKRLKSLKSKINAPPSDPDDQPVPKSVIRLFGLNDKEHQDKKKNKLNKRKSVEKQGGGRGNPVNALKRLPGESAREFAGRISSAARALRDDSHERDYPVEQEEEDGREGRRPRRKKKGKEEPREPRVHRLTLKKQAKKQLLAQEREALAKELRYEHIPLAAEPLAPPALTAPRRAPRATDNAPRPGQRPLLLHALFENAGKDNTFSGSNLGPGVTDEKERARLAAVAAYRELKRRQRPNKVA